MSLYPTVATSALFSRLEVLDRPDLLARVNAMRTRVDVYLRGVGATFSHFTSHAVDHSDQIVRELSSLLFADPTDHETMTISLNAVETYLLLLSAYLHDVGMVVTDDEKLKVLSSEGWGEFASNNEQVSQDMVRLQADLAGANVQSSAEKLFVASLEQRLLLADYFRRLHADRARTTVNDALQVGHDYLDDDPVAITTLIAICVGHGLNRGELASHATYPTRRDVLGEPVNVRLLAILLRLGDLLDMRFERACPLLRSSASPLPNSSGVHWTQYERITSRVTSPREIEVRAECESAEEHRLLQDWCSWLADEVRDAPRLLKGSERHADWSPPHAVIGDTIKIERARGARYRSGDWRFHFDENEVLTRLIRDVHRGHRLGFLQELLQNAMDTSRARAYLLSGSEEEYSNKLPQAVLQQVPVTIACYVKAGRVTHIEVEDRGLGMTEDIVRNYFLQIGRSWYRSPQFAKDFHFNATSRFGVGFLSVFAVSEDVRVTTRWHEDASSNALEMTLPGARNYLLFEDSSRIEPGTTVNVRLEAPLLLSDIADFLSHLCVANEMPIIVQSIEDGVSADVLTLPVRERYVEGGVLPLSESVNLRVREIKSTSRSGVFGSLQFVTVEKDGEADWAAHGERLRDLVAGANPLEEVPRFPAPWVAVNGLRTAVPNIGTATFDRHLRAAIDLRGAEAAGWAGLDRRRDDSSESLLDEDVGKALDEHLASRSPDPEYTAELVRRFESSAPTWADHLPFIRTVADGLVAWDELLALSGFDSLVTGTRSLVATVAAEEVQRAVQIASQRGGTAVCLTDRALRTLSYDRRISLARRWFVTRVTQLTDNVARVSFQKREQVLPTRRPPGQAFAEFDPTSTCIRLELPMEMQILNSTHPFIEAIASIGEENAALRSRLLAAIAKLRHGDPALAELTQAAASSLGNETLSAYAAHMASTYEYKSRYGSGTALHLPLAPPNQPNGGL